MPDEDNDVELAQSLQSMNVLAEIVVAAPYC
jgi:hypothetical protein